MSRTTVLTRDETPGDAPRSPRPGSSWPALLVSRLPVGAAVALTPVMAAAGLAQQFGAWSPVVALPAVAAGIVLAVLAVRWVPLPTPTAPAWAMLGVLAIGAGAGLWAALTHGEHVAIRRDPGAYATYAVSLAHFGGIPIDPRLEVFGLSPVDPFVRVSAAANYQVPVVTDGQVTGLEVVPQFLVGLPAVLTLGWWTAGWTGLFVVPAICGALAIVAFGGLAAAVAGPRLAVVAAATLALTQPVLVANRQTFSEPLSLLFLCAAGMLTVLALRATDPRHVLRLSGLAGFLAGANLFVRIDALREISLLIPVVTVLVFLGHRAATGLTVGLLAGGVPALLAATPWDSPYIAQNDESVVPVAIGGGALLVLCVAVVVARPVLRLGERPWVTRPLSWTPWLLPGLVALVGVVLATRPLWMTDRRQPSQTGADAFVAALQQAQRLPVDPTRSYAEFSVVWTTWWLGPIAVAVAFVAAVVATRVLARALLDGRVPAWGVVFVVGLASTVLTLYRPGITPDHPWADRRLVTTTLPTLVILATVGIGWLVAWAARRGHGARLVAAAGSVAIMIVPPIVATWPLATDRTELGQPEAAEQVCAALPEDAAVVTLDHPSQVLWTPVLRARCDVPIIGVRAPEEGLGGVASRVSIAAGMARADGYVPVALAGTSSGRAELEALELDWERVVDLDTTEPQRLLARRPDASRPLILDLWLARL